MRRAAVVSPLRTAVGSFGGTLKPLTADLLAVAVIQAVMQRSDAMPPWLPACRWRFRATPWIGDVVPVCKPSSTRQ